MSHSSSFEPMHRRVTVVVLCVCLSVTKLATTYMYLVCKSKVHLWRYKHMNCVDFSKNTLFASFASFANSKLLDFSQASDSITLRINRMLYVAHYIRYIHINPL